MRTGRLGELATSKTITTWPKAKQTKQKSYGGVGMTVPSAAMRWQRSLLFKSSMAAPMSLTQCNNEKLYFSCCLSYLALYSETTHN